MRLILMGPPGSGKGTQGGLLARALGVPAISTGDIFRANVAAGSALGLEVRRYLEAGDYVPDDLTNDLVRDRLTQPDCEDGFVLDGFPRTVAQIEVLDQVLLERGVGLDAVVRLSVDVDTLLGRLLRRGTTGGRTDDTEQVIRRRLDLYIEQTTPVTGEYRYRGLIRRVDGTGTVAEVAARVGAALGPIAQRQTT